MSKLHEVLAVEADLGKVATNAINEAKVTFTKKHNLFQGSVKIAEMFSEGLPTPAPVVVKQEETVMSKLGYVAKAASRWLDAVMQKESANQSAKADLVVDGLTLASDVPATFLLGLEEKLKRMRDMYAVMPTLAPGIAWEADTSEGVGVYRTAQPTERFLTNKTIRSKVLYEATKEHPAQIEKWSEDEKVGKYLLSETSGMITPADKSAILGRLDTLVQATRQARMRANTVDVPTVQIGKVLMDYINLG